MNSSFLPNSMFVIATLLLFAFSAVDARRFRAHDSVGIVANTIGPFNNPTETYPVRIPALRIYHRICLFLHLLPLVSTQFYSLPFCSGTGKQVPHKQDLGETLSGSHKITTPYDLTFLDPVAWRSLCEEYLSTVEVSVPYTFTCLFSSFSTHPTVTALFLRSNNSRMLLRMISSSKCLLTIFLCGATSAR